MKSEKVKLERWHASKNDWRSWGILAKKIRYFIWRMNGSVLMTHLWFVTWNLREFWIRPIFNEYWSTWFKFKNLLTFKIFWIPKNSASIFKTHQFPLQFYQLVFFQNLAPKSNPTLKVTVRGGVRVHSHHSKLPILSFKIESSSLLWSLSFFGANRFKSVFVDFLLKWRWRKCHPWRVLTRISAPPATESFFRKKDSRWILRDLGATPLRQWKCATFLKRDEF